MSWPSTLRPQESYEGSRKKRGAATSAATLSNPPQEPAPDHAAAKHVRPLADDRRSRERRVTAILRRSRPAASRPQMEDVGLIPLKSAPRHVSASFLIVPRSRFYRPVSQIASRAVGGRQPACGNRAKRLSLEEALRRDGLGAASPSRRPLVWKVKSWSSEGWESGGGV